MNRQGIVDDLIAARARLAIATAIGERFELADLKLTGAIPSVMRGAGRVAADIHAEHGPEIAFVHIALATFADEQARVCVTPGELAPVVGAMIAVLTEAG